MRKIRLELEDLAVESFATDAADGRTGTVRGNDLSIQCATQYTGQPDCPGCQVSGAATCVYCQADTETCQNCSWTNGDGAECYW
jgi:hypothetical protein